MTTFSAYEISPAGIDGISANLSRGLRRLFRDEPVMAGTALMLLAMIPPTLVAHALDARLFNGINVWDKPLKFEIALFVYTATLAYFARYMAPAIRDDWRYRTFSGIAAFCIAAEMAWIGGAAAFGAGSHFNVASPVMGSIYGLMGVFAVTLTAMTLAQAHGIRQGESGGAEPLSPFLRAAIVQGLVATFILTVIAAGYMSSQTGHWVGGDRSDGQAAMLMGWARDGGDLRVSHFFATHALHFTPILAIAIARFAPALATRRTVWGLTAVYAAFTLGTMAQAIAGRPFAAGLL
jgi:hypothetical protein